MRSFVLAAAPLIFAPSIALAEIQWPGNDVAPGCRIAASDKNSFGENRSDAAISGFCMGIVAGVVPVGPTLPEPFRFCPPNGWTTRQAVKVFANFLNQHPAVLHEPIADLALIAFRESWPCQKK
jgi:Rap1a immunity proteins